MNEYTLLKSGIENLIENIKILLYKEKIEIFDILDFGEDSIYQEPLFFVYFKNKEEYKKYLDSIIFGYSDNSDMKIKVKSDKYGKVYIPQIGWLITEKKLENFELSRRGKDLLLKQQNNLEDFKHESSKFVQGTNIELLKYPVPILEQFYYDEYSNRIEVEIENITKKHAGNLSKAFQLIKKHIPVHYQLIESVTKKVVIFNVNDDLRNSFATLSAQGIAFFNACQDDYNEVFFIDDIAHQTGHIIFNAMIYNINEFLKVKPGFVVQELKNDKGKTVETRDIHVVFHALYTYYTTFICLDAMLENNVFDGEKLHEILGRMKFYIGKCFLDLRVIDNPITETSKAKKLFTEKGFKIYDSIREKYLEMNRKWMPKVQSFKLDNQLYNFSYSRFKKLNPIP
jgi:hypothetical protein